MVLFGRLELITGPDGVDADVAYLSGLRLIRSLLSFERN